MRILTLFSRHWIKTTVLVIAAIAVMVRLGIWQLDRLEARRAFNSRVEAQLAEPVFELSMGNPTVDLENMEYRSIIVTGTYDYSQQVVLRNQAWESRLGVHLLTPLIIEDSEQVVLIDRGWIPFEDFTEGELWKYNESSQVEVHGMIRRSQAKAEIGGRTDQVPGPGEEPLLAWNLVNVDGIASQTSSTFLPVYIQQAPDPSWNSLPYRSLPTLELTEGPHLGYAIQWFAFALILAIGYPLYIRKDEYAYKQAAKVSTRKLNLDEPQSLKPKDKQNEGHSRI
jgi:surfeit locus 1 family protein